MKQDLNGVRTAQDLEQKYNLGVIEEIKKETYDNSKKIEDTNKEFKQFTDSVTKDLGELHDQVDGNITTWFQSGVPTLDNYPANEWITEEDKIAHLGDLYYDRDTGYSYRFNNENGVYNWLKLSDSDISKALAVANSAQDTADSKRRVFLEQPIPPYDSGDMWIKDKEIYICQISKPEGEVFAEKDFINELKYTDNTYAEEVDGKLTIVAGTVTEIREDVDNLETTMTNTTQVVNEQGEQIGLLEEKQSQTSQTVDEISASVSQINVRVEEISKSVEVFIPTIEPDLVLVPTYENGLPKTSTEYFVEYSAKLEGNDVTPTVTCQSENEGITLAITDKLTFTVNSSVEIPNKDNKYELLFSYNDGQFDYSKTIVLYLMRVNENEDLSERLEQVEKDLNNNYPNNDELNEALEGQKATIIEETSTMIEQSASEVTTSIINKVNTDGVTTLKNTLVTIDINGINVAKNDEDVVSLLDNKGLYVSDGKLKEDESNLLMKTDRNGAYFKSATIDGTIKEQGLFQKEVIEDDDFGKGQAGFWIGG